jgi:hypothetical protein
MTASQLYRISSVLLALFALGHTMGFRRVDSKWGADSVVGGMKTVTFPVQGFDRSYWDFFSGFGFFVSALLVFAAILAWRFGSMPHAQLATMSVERWSFAICFVVVAVMTWRYFFAAPGVFSSLVALSLVAAAWLGS